MGVHTIDEPDASAEFAYQRGDRFRDHRGTEWTINSLSWEFTITYIEDRDGIPAREDHRCYRLGNADLETQRVVETDLHGFERVTDE